MNELRVIIVEDETGAANSLRLLLKEISESVNILAIIPGVNDTLQWLKNNEHPDLAFFDIQLEDGTSFEIFKKANINFPVIFTTAYDQYAIEAFKVNSIDYLLKPVKEQELRFSLNKFNALKARGLERETAQKIIDAIDKTPLITTFLIHFKDRLIPVSASDMAYFYIAGGLVHGCTKVKKIYPVEKSMDELERSLDKKMFFRANRQFIINRSAVKEVEFYFNGKYLLNMEPPSSENIIISKAKIPLFKAWIKGEIG